MTEEEVRERVEEVRASLLDGALDDVVEDTGGLGLCAFVSEELVSALFDLEGCLVYAPPAWSVPHYNGKLAGPHWVALFDGWVVDLTARQWDATLPYPHIFAYPAD